MPQQSALYGVARIRVHEKALLDRALYARLIDAAAPEALRLLVDAGYGGMPDATLADVETMIDRELAAAYALVEEVTPKERKTDVFRMKADVHNLKLLLKLRLTGSKDAPVLMQGGVIPADTLKAMVDAQDYSMTDALPVELRDALDSLEVGFYTRVDPVEVSVQLDNAYAKYALSLRDPFISEYFNAKADFDNIAALLRLSAMGAATPEKLHAVLIDAGEIGEHKLIAAAELPVESLAKAVAAGNARDAITAGLASVVKTGHISAIEKARDDYLIKLAAKNKGDNESIAPIIGYLLAREQEARCVRLIMTAKRNGLEESVITERLREIYG